MRLEGILSVFKLYGKIEKVSTKNLEELAKTMLRQLKVVGQRYVEEEVGDEDVESVRVKIYAEAFASLAKEGKWSVLEIDRSIYPKKTV